MSHPKGRNFTLDPNFFYEDCINLYFYYNNECDKMGTLERRDEWCGVNVDGGVAS